MGMPEPGIPMNGIVQIEKLWNGDDIMPNLCKKIGKDKLVLAISLIVILLASLIAQAFNTSGYSVSVDRIYFDTERGTLSGLLYMPDGVSAANPAPTLVTTHGYLNSAEMQDANAIEMSRRGYVVLALDQYDHGHSQANSENTGGFFSFWPTSVFDAVSYMYQQDYVLKDEAGNGIIGVSGHSMGGFSASYAVYLDETAFFPATGRRMIYAILTEGSDYKWSTYIGFDTAAADATAGGRYYGKVAAQYDEFFFNEDVWANDTVVHKDYVNTPEGRIFLQQTGAESAQAYTWYHTSDGGYRIVFQPAQTHPWNHFSKTTTASLLEFYSVAFADYSDGIKDIPATNQIWQLKEAAECVALVAFIVFIMALATVLLKVPFLKNAKTGEAVTTPPCKTAKEKIASVSLFIATMLIPAIIFPTMYTLGLGSESAAWIRYTADIAILLSVVSIVLALTSKDEGKKSLTISSAVILIAGICLRIMITQNAVTQSFFGNGKLFKAGVPTSIIQWALVCAFISVIILTTVYLFSKKNQGATLANYGVKAGPLAILSSFVIAIILSVVAFGVLFLVDALFTTDFRIWTFAFKTFEPECISASLIYIPFFFIYYLVAGAGAVTNTTSEKLQGVAGYIVASLTNMGGILVWLILQYGMLFANGKAFYPAEALSGILLIALVPTLAVASCYSKYIYKKTGNVWTAAFLNAILMTVMTVANTTVYYQLG